MRIWSRETVSAVPSRVSLPISILRLNLICTSISHVRSTRPKKTWSKGKGYRQQQYYIWGTQRAPNLAHERTFFYWAGTLIRMNDRQLPRQVVFVAKFEGAVRRGRGGKGKVWINCAQCDIRTFGLAGNWKVTALEAGVWVESVTDGKRSFMAAWLGEIRRRPGSTRPRESLLS